MTFADTLRKLFTLDRATEDFKKIVVTIAQAAQIHVGLKARRSRNALQRANGTEPEPGFKAGVKNWARYHKRVVSSLPEAPHVHPRRLRGTAS